MAMPEDATYSISELADMAGVTPRTIRYYLAQGLLPSAGQTGPGTRYSASHLARLRVIRGLQAEHLPLAEIRRRLADLDDDEILALAEQDAPPPPDSALEYVRAVLRDSAADPTAPRMRHASYSLVAPMSADAASVRPLALASAPAPTAAPANAPANASAPAPPHAERLGESHHSTVKAGERSQWERIVLATDIELHIRRPLSRTQNKRVDRLVTIARELLEEDPS